MSVEPGKLHRLAQPVPGAGLSRQAARNPSTASASRNTTGFPAARACATTAASAGTRLVQPSQHDTQDDAHLGADLRGASRVTPGQVLKRFGEQAAVRLHVGLGRPRARR